MRQSFIHASHTFCVFLAALLSIFLTAFIREALILNAKITTQNHSFNYFITLNFYLSYFFQPKSPFRPEFSSFIDLKRHMSRVHDLCYCDLCTQHLELFSWERKYYTRQQLALHRKEGDGDDKSHKGKNEAFFVFLFKGRF